VSQLIVLPSPIFWPILRSLAWFFPFPLPFLDPWELTESTDFHRSFDWTFLGAEIDFIRRENIYQQEQISLITAYVSDLIVAN